MIFFTNWVKKIVCLLSWHICPNKNCNWMKLVALPDFFESVAARPRYYWWNLALQVLREVQFAWSPWRRHYTYSTILQSCPMVQMCVIRTEVTALLWSMHRLWQERSPPPLSYHFKSFQSLQWWNVQFLSKLLHLTKIGHV